MEAIVRLFLSRESDVHDALTPDEAFTDVVAESDQGERYVASFFSYKSLELLRQRHRKDGDFLDGKYFWAVNMVLIDECTRESIEQVVKDLIEEGDFDHVFRKI